MGLTRDTNRKHICRAVLEGIAYQVYDLAATMEGDSGLTLTALKVDGGASVSNVMMQFQSDLLNIPVNRPKCVESTALGAAYLAALGLGLYKDTAELAALWQSERVFLPAMPPQDRQVRLLDWQRAVELSKNWEK